MKHHFLDVRDLGKELNNLMEFPDEDQDRLDALLALCKELSIEPDELIRYNEPCLIPDDCFEEYARDLADDCGLLDAKVGSRWPYTCIDWKLASEELQYDYTSVEFDGETYWIRNI